MFSSIDWFYHNLKLGGSIPEIQAGSRHVLILPYAGWWCLFSFLDFSQKSCSNIISKSYLELKPMFSSIDWFYEQLKLGRLTSGT